MELRKLWLLPVAAFALAGCAQDDGPLGPGPGEGAGASEVQATLTCQVSVPSGDVSCSAPQGSPGSASGALIGGQGLHVQLESSNVSYDAGSSVFSADVSVRNLLDQTLGTADGVSPDAEGVRIFFVDDPQVTGGNGAVTVRNPDGTAEFNRTGQPYFQYSQAVSPGGRSLPKNWEWDVPGTVERFTFVVGVSAKLANETAINPGLKFVAQRIAADTLHTCVLDLSGQAYCWGAGGSGRLGNDGTTSQATPGPVEGGLKFGTIITGHQHTCGIALDGQGYCWGSNGDSRLGHGGTGVRYTPDLIAGDYRWTQLSASSSNTCGVTVDGEGYCWGFGSARLGDGIGAVTNTPSRVLDPPTGESRWAMISSAHLHTCGITIDGTAYCWGSNGPGRLGIGALGGTPNAPGEPVASQEKFVHISAGERHNCAVTAAGVGYCWGMNTQGQIGNGVSGDTVLAPVQVAGGHKFAEIHTGWDFSCGLAFDGDAYCWGLANDGRLGNGTTSGSQNEPVLVQGGHKFRYLATGLRHACGVTIGGAVYCWGFGADSQLGNGSAANQDQPTLVPGLTNIAWLNTLPAAGCADGAQRATCFPARSALESYAFSGWNAVPRRVDFLTSLAGPLAGA